jgi:transcriptional regulator with GAF, ATPase, and Fis domain
VSCSIRSALARTHRNQSQAAQLLGVKITTLHAKIKRYGISFNGNRTISEVSE